MEAIAIGRGNQRFGITGFPTFHNNFSGWRVVPGNLASTLGKGMGEDAGGGGVGGRLLSIVATWRREGHLANSC